MKDVRVAAGLIAGLLAGIHPALAQNWVLTSAPDVYWQAVASSADGNKLVAAVNRGPIYVSPDGGITWAATSATNASWQSVASSADGNTLIAAAYTGEIYVST